MSHAADKPIFRSAGINRSRTKSDLGAFGRHLRSWDDRRRRLWFRGLHRGVGRLVCRRLLPKRGEMRPSAEPRSVYGRIWADLRLSFRMGDQLRSNRRVGECRSSRLRPRKRRSVPRCATKLNLPALETLSRTMHFAAHWPCRKGRGVHVQL